MLEINGEKLYTTNEVAQILRKRTNTILKYCLAGEIESTKIGGSYYISESAIKDYVKGAADHDKRN